MSAADRAITAQRRFGFGVMPGLYRDIASDPQGYVIAQLQGQNYHDTSGLPASDALLRDFVRVHRAGVREKRSRMNGFEAFREKRAFVRARFRDEVDYRTAMAVGTETPLIERLVAFWSDHFCISSLKGHQVRVIAGAYEREAIRPYVTGRFRDMLGAVMHHPAMLLYLDNAGSIGPDSKVGRRTGQGLNENLGRELMELHTVGVNGGYDQQDVIAAAKAITGWGISKPSRHKGGVFRFSGGNHEPGTFTVMNAQFRERGERQGEALLDMLAAHPSTARHIAGKLARYFVGDAASDGLVKTVADRFLSTDGDLKETVTALLEAPESWEAPPRKVIPPFDLLVAAQRMTGARLGAADMIAMSATLGQPFWAPRSPAGFPKDDNAWAAPGTIVQRLDNALKIADSSRDTDPMRLAEESLGGAMSGHLADAISRSATRQEAVAMLIMSPEIQMR